MIGIGQHIYQELYSLGIIERWNWIIKIFTEETIDNWKNIEDASLKWFIQSEAITADDFEKYQIIRKRRNDITYELLKNLNDGFTEKDAKLFADMLEIYNKIDK